MIIFGKDLSVDENALSFIGEEQTLSPSSAVVPGENMKSILGIEGPFEQPSIKESTQVAGSGVSVQTERGLLESGVHPDEEMQKTWDERKQKKTTEPTYKDTGRTFKEEYKARFGEEALRKLEEKQNKELEDLLKQRGEK